MELTRFCAKAETAAQMISFPTLEYPAWPSMVRPAGVMFTTINLVFPLPENGYKNTTGQYYDWWYQFRFIFPIKSPNDVPSSFQVFSISSIFW